MPSYPHRTPLDLAKHCIVTRYRNVVDGDTLDAVVNGHGELVPEAFKNVSGDVRVRLAAIDTPERGQVFYDDAKEQLHRDCRRYAKAGLYILPTAWNGDRIVGIPLGWANTKEKYLNDISMIELHRGWGQCRKQYLHDLESAMQRMGLPGCWVKYWRRENYAKERMLGIWQDRGVLPVEFKREKWR